MPLSYYQRMKFGTLSSCIYDSQEVINSWNKQGQGRAQTLSRLRDCILIPTSDVNFAVKYARDFCENFFNILTCTHWDRKTLVLYYGDAGGGANHLKQSLMRWLDTRQVLYAVSEDPYSGPICAMP